MEQKKQMDNAVNRLLKKIERANPLNQNISEYNQRYLKNYIDNYSFYMSLYAQLLQKAIRKLNKPIAESTFVDYGGGCGMLSYLAKEIGFKCVVYTDIYQESIHDTQTIAQAIGISIDHYICGDVDALVDGVNQHAIKPDLICSFDVLEHIYDLKKWFKIVSSINSNFSLLFMTSANSRNPFVVNRLKKMQNQSEYKGVAKTFGWKEMDINTSFLEARKSIIKKQFPELTHPDIELLSTKTRGLRRDGIENVVENYLNTGEITYQIKHPTNTCDPYTGNWTEHLIDLKELKRLLKNLHLNVNITNAQYSYSTNKILNIPKYLLNVFIKVLGSKHLFFSPTYTLEVHKQNSK